MEIKIGRYELKNDVEVKVIPDGLEIFRNAVEKYGIKPEDFEDATWSGDSIIVEKI